MSSTFVADKQICFNLQGLRYIKKEDYFKPHAADNRYFISLQYKGASARVEYSSDEERDEIFDLAVSKLKAFRWEQI